MAEVINQANCPRDTMVGTATLLAFSAGARFVITVPVYNIAPGPGEPAAFAFDGLFFPVRLDTSVLSDGEYNIRVEGSDLTGGAGDYMTSITIWGDPAEHNGPGPDAAAKNGKAERFWKTTSDPQVSFGGAGVEEFDERSMGVGKRCLSSCAVVDGSVAMFDAVDGDPGNSDSWEEAGVFTAGEASMGTATGCGDLSFKPGISMLPDTLEAGEPAGYSII